MKLLHNLSTLLARPTLAAEYVQYSLSRARHGGEAVRRFPADGVEVGGLNGFSEYHTCADGLDERERAFVKTYSFAEGALLDVGANLGLFSLLFARRFPKRVVYAFEPNPSTCAALRSNFARNHCAQAQAHAAAAADHDGEVSFQADPHSRATASIGGPVGSGTVTVPCVTLDGFARDRQPGPVALLKVDVEGHEARVFRGAAGLLASGDVALVYFEVCPELTRRAGFAPEDAARQLEAHGYQLHRFDARGDLAPVATSEITAVQLENWLALRPA